MATMNEKRAAVKTAVVVLMGVSAGIHWHSIAMGVLVTAGVWLWTIVQAESP